MSKAAIGIGLAALILAGVVSAEENSSKDGFGADFSFDGNKKHYKTVELTTQTLTFSPSYRWGDITIALDIPYIHESLEGDITFKRVPKKWRKVSLIRRNSITIPISESDSGMGDMSVSLSDKFWRSEDRADELSATYIHKFDNGSDDYAIGSGSVDDTLELAYSHYWVALSATLAGGHTNVNGDGTNELQQNSSYTYGYLDMSYMLNDYIALGIMYDYAQSQYEDKPDHAEISYSISAMPTDSTLLKVYYVTDGEKGQPEWESGVSASYSY